MLKVHDVSKSFGGLLVIDSFSMEVQPNQIVGIIGPNGAGKTTLFNIITGYLSPDRGTVTLDNHNITKKKPEKINRYGIARTFQLVKPFANMTVLENVMIGAFSHTSKTAEARRIAQEYVELVGLQNKANEKAGKLSLPERKQIELARALATEPKYLFLDEVFSGLNPTEIEEIIKLIHSIKELKKISFVVIEHNVRVISGISDKVYVLHHGVVIAEGTPEEVLTNQEVVAAYLGG
ncbi:ABC transporter ATP-binding protein [Neobacillus niacini]|uniref:ABC transporter ATP-binding protein n=1 Tax=Neobacillus niacini TaxID=86668 RepID=UPI0021CB6E01|nr:ABC transporter ATP-binding protein [Neobacillus niacini]MCM3766199.1 ABC transporter ATP-binding protein [Neobacillus niacini]